MKRLFMYSLASAMAMGISFNISANELAQSLTPHLERIYDRLTIQAEQTTKSCRHLHHSLATTKEKTKESRGVTRDDIDRQFKELLLNWKRTQSIYVISEYDFDAIDMPHYIDVYHRGNENLSKQMQRIVQSTDDAQTALFKYSFKSINALEYVLYASSTAGASKTKTKTTENKETGDTPKTPISQRQRELSLVITEHICGRLQTIEDFYHQLKGDFLYKPKKAVAVLLNELIDSNYKLKEWRLGDASGLSPKRRGKPNAKYSEYRLSHLSIPAARAILEAHITMTKADSDFSDIIAILAEHEESEEPLQFLADARHYVLQSNTLLHAINAADISDTATIKPLYIALNRLHDSYFVGLIESLSDIVARILDSDGD